MTRTASIADLSELSAKKKTNKFKEVSQNVHKDNVVKVLYWNYIQKPLYGLIIFKNHSSLPWNYFITKRTNKYQQANYSI